MNAILTTGAKTYNNSLLSKDFIVAYGIEQYNTPAKFLSISQNDNIKMVNTIAANFLSIRYLRMSIFFIEHIYPLIKKGKKATVR